MVVGENELDITIPPNVDAIETRFYFESKPEEKIFIIYYEVRNAKMKIFIKNCKVEKVYCSGINMKSQYFEKIIKEIRKVIFH